MKFIIYRRIMDLIKGENDEVPGAGYEILETRRYF
jgi:hypothetical protein